MVVVYRADVDGRRYYPRLAEEQDQDLSTDALVLERLRTQGVRVPAVVAVSPPTSELPRSWIRSSRCPTCRRHGPVRSDSSSVGVSSTHSGRSPPVSKSGRLTADIRFPA